MTTAKEIAHELFESFVSAGMFNVSTRSFAEAWNGITPSSSTDKNLRWREEDGDFANVSVQAIGYEEYYEDNDKHNPAIYIYISKGAEKALNKIEKEKNGIPIKLRRLTPTMINMRNYQKSLNTPQMFIGSNSEIACGSSCSPVKAGLAGTMGAIIKRKNDENYYILSNNHVIGGCNHAPRGTIIMSPAPVDAMMHIAPREVGRLEFIYPLMSGYPDFVPPCKFDVALAKVTDNKLLTSWQGDIQNGYDTPKRLLPLKSGMLVKKVGRTTGLTHGIVQTRVLDYMKLSYDLDGFNATVYFTEFWIITGINKTNFALEGDSGSLVVTEDGSAAVGLVFASGFNGGIACVQPLFQVLESVGGTGLVSGHGLTVFAANNERTTQISK